MGEQNGIRLVFGTQDRFLMSPNGIANFNAPENVMERKLCVAIDRNLLTAEFPRC